MPGTVHRHEPPRLERRYVCRSPVPVKQVQPHAGTDPHPFRSLLQYGGDGAGTGYRRTVPSWGSKRLRLWQPPVHIHPPDPFPMSLIYWSGRPSAAKEGEVFHPPGFLSILYRPEAYPPAQMTPGETSQSVRKICSRHPVSHRTG